MSELSWNWATWGTIGDPFGGLANAVGLLVILFGAYWARGEIKRARTVARNSIKVELVRDIWRAVSGQTTALGLLIQLASEKRPLPEVQLATDALMKARERFIDAIADAALFPFPRPNSS